MHSNLEIQHLVQGCIQQDENCQRALVHQFSGMLYSICLRYIGDAHKAKDTLQDSFIRIFKAIHQYNPERGSLQGWMRKITVNVALKQLKKEKLRKEGPMTENLTDFHRAPKVAEKLDTDDLMKLVMTLPEGYRQIFNLSVIEGYNHREIGKMVGIEEATSRSQLSRAKQLLRQKISKLENSESWARIS